MLQHSRLWAAGWSGYAIWFDNVLASQDPDNFERAKEDLMRMFILSDINPPNDQGTALPFLLEGDAMDYYHSLTKQVQEDWYELMGVLGQCFDCISHDPVY